LVGVENLVDLVSKCLWHAAAANQAVLVSDGEDLSIAELLHRVCAELNRPARLIAVRPALLDAGAHLVGKRDVARRLMSSLQVDIDRTRNRLGWGPPVSVAEGLRLTATWFTRTDL
jgi:nucleoside-diphosphate-sugar epimerase